MTDRVGATERAPGVRPPTRAQVDRAFEFGQELGGPAPTAVGRGTLLDGAEEARRFADFVRRRREPAGPNR